jgi:hypothetical protein
MHIIIICFLQVNYCYSLSLRGQNFTFHLSGDLYFMHASILKFVLSPNCLSVLEIVIFEILLGKSETLLCLLSAPHVKNVHQLLMFVGTVIYSEPRTSFLILRWALLLTNSV